MNVRKLLLLILLLLFGRLSALNAQALTPQFLGSGGNNLQNIRGSLSFSVGEMATSTIRQAGAILTQGFQQGEILHDTICRYFAADAFTPSQSVGLNDFFRPISACEPQLYELLIFNRWGKNIYRTVNPLEGWDGKEAGELAPPGTYLWRLSYRFGGPPSGVTKIHGTVNLLR